MFDSVLVANRAEIAVRVIRTLRRLGIRAVAVYSDADVAAPHVRLADEAVRLGPTPPAQSYLAVDRVVRAAVRTGAQAVHPGYGFLSESAVFARACAAAGVVFVGPPPDAIEAMGDKIRSKHLAEEAGVPVVPGVHRPDLDDAALRAAADGVGYPLMVKASAGGGGKGMRVVGAPADLPAALAAARREAVAAFGDGALLLERLVPRPRHVEVQVLADTHGTVRSLGERECSLQRRHQKVVEEAPSPLLDPDRRARMGASAVDLAAAVGYTGAGTVEFIVAGDDPDDYAFLEMNTRLQVEHPVTEAVTGLDLVEQQLRVAAGERLDPGVGAAGPAGSAVEARVYAEDPDRGFLPTGGRIARLVWPAGEGVRVDAGVAEGDHVGSAYDPMLAKVIATGPDRATALRRLDAALAGTVLLGVTTNVGFLRRLLADPRVRAGDLDTGIVEGLAAEPGEVSGPAVVAALAALAADEAPGRGAGGAGRAGGAGGVGDGGAGGARDPFDLPGSWRVGGPAWRRHRLRVGGVEVEVATRGRSGGAEVAVDGAAPVDAAITRTGAGTAAVTVAGRTATWHVAADGPVTWVGTGGRAWAVTPADPLAVGGAVTAGLSGGPLRAPLPGTVLQVAVAEGDRVTAGQTLVILEAMKMEHPVTAPGDGVVRDLAVRAGQQVPIDAPLVTVEPEGAGP